MPKILLVEASPRGAESVSRRLAAAVIDRLRARDPQSTLVVRDLTERPLPHVGPELLAALRHHPSGPTPDQQRVLADSDAVIDEVLACEVLVIGTPMWNYSVPSVLKVWVDHLARSGRTFRYVAGGPQGLLGGRRAYVAVATGGIYSHGPGAARDFVTPYLRAVLQFLGIDDVRATMAEGTAMPQHAPQALARAIADIVID